MSDLEQTTDNSSELLAVELETLKAKADLIGMKYHPTISAEKLREKIAKHVAGEPEVELAKAEVKTAERETAGQKAKRIRDAGLALVRVNISCLNPHKTEWDGEIFSIGNAVIPTQKKFVPFNTPDGYHIPQIMVDVIRDRQCQIFYNERSKNGINVRKGKLIKEFSVQILPPLTAEELAELARQQAASGIIQG